MASFKCNSSISDEGKLVFSFWRGPFVQMVVPESMGKITCVSYVVGTLFLANNNAELFAYNVDKPEDVLSLNLLGPDFHAGPLSKCTRERNKMIVRMSVSINKDGKRSVVVQAGWEILFFEM